MTEKVYFCNMKNKSTFAIYTLGCKLNFSESSDMGRQLMESGFGHSEKPDFLILNSCAVTSAAEKKARNLVSKLHRENPESKIIVMGCFAALRPAEILKWDGVVATFGSEDKMNVIPFIKGESVAAKPEFFSTFSANDRTRSFLKIQDGCDYHCTYCTVCQARGNSRSDTIENVLAQFDKLLTYNIKEVNLTGVNLGDFGRKIGTDFYQLLCAIEQKKYSVRLRISSIEPNLLTDDIIALCADSEIIMPHFHIPLQSGCNKILELMKRRYHRELFADKIYQIKEKMPHACIALDVIAGFPHETPADFEDTYNFLKSLPISYLHVFTYSKRPNTPAATMDEQVSPQEKKWRTLQLIELSNEKKNLFYHQHIGESRKVLIEAESKGNWMFGFTDNYIKIKIPYNELKINTIEDVLLEPERFSFS